MSQQSGLIKNDITSYLNQHQPKTMLRFITCSSLDDGKSTLIGRLLYESNLLFDDQLAVFEKDSKKYGPQGGDLDFALLVDGLAAEREQSITIDVAYRFFTTHKRKYIVADTPDHEQCTRNIVAGASTADAAVILIDARHGVMTQTRRLSYLAHLIGIRRVVVAINKMDLVDYSQERFEAIEQEYRHFADQLGLEDITLIPLSALKGDNINTPSAHMPWYQGSTLLSWLDNCEVSTDAMQGQPFRFMVQGVNRPNLDFRGYSGMIVAGQVQSGDRVLIQPSDKESTVERIVTFDRDLDQAVAGQALTLTLKDELDISRGDVISVASAPCEVSDQFECTIVWMSDCAMYPGRPYRILIGTQWVNATITALKHRVDFNTLAQEAATKLELNHIGICNISFDQPVPFEAYAKNRELGGFIIIDRISNQTVGAGMVHFALRRSHHIYQQYFDINMQARAQQKGQRPVVLWFTGLSGAGKSTIANEVEQQLFALGRHSYLLDGDNVRHGLNRDLGFTDADRVENIRRVSEVAKLMMDSGLIVLAAFISPFRAERMGARESIGDNQFYEIYVDTPLRVAEKRDVKGLYKKARKGELRNFTGIDSPYEVPADPALIVTTENETPDQSAAKVINFLKQEGII